MKTIKCLAILFIAVCTTYAQENLHYTINLNDQTDDTFKVLLSVNSLSQEDSIYQFASTAPGTYQIEDIGRFVKNFEVFDKNGKQLSTLKKSVNQYRISEPSKVSTISYEVSDTWDTPVKVNPVYKMAGSSLETDHALINAHCMIGFPITRQAEAVSMELIYPENWVVGTALNKNDNGYFVANSFDHLIDSPILLGNLTQESVIIGNTKIEVYTYSKTGLIKSEMLLNDLKDLLIAAEKFLKGYPVDRYTFLFHFEDETVGAWEHSYSSEYVYQESEYTEAFSNSIVSVVAHEFFHIVTPLNIHSEIIEQFNFTNPTPSVHLWLYEGVTEWASGIMQLRGNILTLEELLAEYRQKLIYNDYFDPNYSLQDLALTSFTPKGAQQYSNIYMKGAIIAALLDIRLLELSKGKQGLRELILQLSAKYGKDKAFSEENFFEEIVQMTHPEIKEFIDKYIVEADPLPIQEYFDKIGITYVKNKKVKKESGKEETIKHYFEVNNDATKKQKKLRELWQSNN
ncbi:M61 family metallopeptidase [Fulvivirga lutea]|uniref:Peptidase n=1 Tax=Fulvivirga lutea TaxID=2810512 RepID=A0A974WIM9_9BACT|nr:peptidase [Fulvivirga lutea]QSE99136.1 peptidase [Fulvivirga lutea]